MKIERLSVYDLSNDPANARKHDERNIAAIVASLRRFEQQKPIVVDANNVVRAGNGTLEAARILGWDKIDAVRTKLTGSDATAYAIADNRTAELAAWDDAILAAELQGLVTEDEDLLAAAGFTDEELAELLKGVEPEPEIVEDEVPEPPAIPKTRPGDLWLLGEHRLLCGDSTKAEDVARLMGGEKADACVTDPPYGLGVDATMHKQGGTQYGKAAAPKKHYAATNWDKLPPKHVIDAASSFNESIIFGGNYFELPPSRCWLVWDKENGDNAFADCELAWTNLDKPVRVKRHMWNGMIRKDKEERADHPTQKPVGVMAWCVEMTSGLIYDPFLGSGTTLIAAEQLGRRCFGMEISPQYCDVIVKRWETLTGNQARLSTDARS